MCYSNLKRLNLDFIPLMIRIISLDLTIDRVNKQNNFTLIKNDQIKEMNQRQRQRNSYPIKSDNLIPIYLLEDNLKQNFKSMEIFIQDQIKQNKIVHQQINQLNVFDQNIVKKIDSQFVQTENRIIKNINNQIEGKITVILNQRLNTLMERIAEKQTLMDGIQLKVSKQIQQLKKKILYEMTQQNQKFFTKEIKKVQKELQKKVQRQSQVSKIKSLIGAQKTTKKQSQAEVIDSNINSNNVLSGQNVGNSNWQQNHLLLIELQQKISKLQQFSIGIDQRFYDHSTTLKQGWKQLGNQILDTKNKLTKKVELISIDFAKIKSQMQFVGMPNEIDQSYKVKLIEKFTEIYKVLTTFVTKTEFDSTIDRSKRANDRTGNQIDELKLRLAKNDEYFTFYMNNANTDDLNSQLQKIRMEIVQDKQVNHQFFEELKTKIKLDHNIITQIGTNLQQIQSFSDDLNSKIQVTVNNILKCTERIQKLQDFNDMGPSKMKKIHDILDFDMAPGVQSAQLFGSTQNHNSNKLGKQSKELKIQIDKLKDQFFFISNQSKVKNQELQQTKRTVKKLQQKLQKIKNESQEAVISRKPWICLSCDKNQRDPQRQIKRKLSNKKIDIGKSGGGFFSGRQREKSLKNINPSGSPFEQKFEIYEKFRQKYLADTLKLPEIYKQKIGDLQNSLL